MDLAGAERAGRARLRLRVQPSDGSAGLSRVLRQLLPHGRTALRVQQREFVSRVVFVVVCRRCRSVCWLESELSWYGHGTVIPPTPRAPAPVYCGCLIPFFFHSHGMIFPFSPAGLSV